MKLAVENDKLLADGYDAGRKLRICEWKHNGYYLKTAEILVGVLCFMFSILTDIVLNKPGQLINRKKHASYILCQFLIFLDFKSLEKCKVRYAW